MRWAWMSSTAWVCVHVVVRCVSVCMYLSVIESRSSRRLLPSMDCRYDFLVCAKKSRVYKVKVMTSVFNKCTHTQIIW